MRGIHIAALAIALLAGCAQQAELLKQTPSGYPEETFRGATVDSVRDLLMDACASRGELVQESAGSSILCGRTMTGGNAIMMQLLLGNSYSTTPEAKTRYTLIQRGADVRVTAQQWVETQMAFGQMKRVEMNGANNRNALQQTLSDAARRALPAAAPATQHAATVVRQVTATPVAIPAPQTPAPGAPAVVIGQDSSQVERLARDQACHTTPLASLVTKGPGFETYTVTCASGDAWMFRCEFGNCRLLQ